jgi:fluoride exporter
MLANFAVVGLGGFAGSALRYAVGLLAVRALPSFPLGTLLVNVTGCYLIGVLAILVPDGRPRLFWLTGVLGGYTTFSSFGLDSLVLWRDGHETAAVFNVAVQLVFGLLAVAAGAATARAAS